jgi:hypothetical protein
LAKAKRKLAEIKRKEAEARRTVPSAGLWCTTKQSIVMMNSISAIEHSADLLVEGGMAMLTKKRRTGMEDFVSLMKALNVASSVVTNSQ